MLAMPKPEKISLCTHSALNMKKDDSDDECTTWRGGQPCPFRLWKWPDFKAQKSLVQEVITAAGRLCTFLPKYHCELNFIEFFWGAVKRWLRDNCDYTFS